MPLSRQCRSVSFLIEAEISHQREVIGRILHGRYPVDTDLLPGGEGQPPVDAKMPPAVEDVIDGVAALAVPADLPRRVGRFRPVLPAVGRVELKAGVVHDGPVHRLDGLGVKVTAKDDGDVIGDALLQEIQDVFPLLVAQRRQERPLPGFQVGCRHADLTTAGLVSEHRQYQDLQSQQEKPPSPPSSTPTPTTPPTPPSRQGTKTQEKKKKKRKEKETSLNIIILWAKTFDLNRVVM